MGLWVSQSPTAAMGGASNFRDLVLRRWRFHSPARQFATEVFHFLCAFGGVGRLSRSETCTASVPLALFTFKQNGIKFVAIDAGKPASRSSGENRLD